MVVKIVALFIAVWAGASTGREGPTVHVACCLFVGVLLAFRKFLGLRFDPRSAVIAGSAAGLAAAFNTPLAGVVFAVEELSTGYFGAVKDLTVMAIIVAATAARLITGEYAYFGRLSEPNAIPLTAVLVIGVLGGVAGAAFSTGLVQGRRFFSRLEKKSVGRYFWPALLACAVAGLALLGGPNTLGPGNKAAQELVSGSFGSWVYTFPFVKALATLCTYWAGVAGGLFAPCLAVGAALGASVAGLATAECAMAGMATFLSGTIQAPITSFVIIFEMTGHHQMLLPVMLAAMVAFIVARLFKAQHLYHALAENYSVLLKEPPAPVGATH